MIDGNETQINRKTNRNTDAAEEAGEKDFGMKSKWK
jgi:hypothetical protein